MFLIRGFCEILWLGLWFFYFLNWKRRFIIIPYTGIGETLCDWDKWSLTLNQIKVEREQKI